jgi:hypothetical protein
LHNVEADVGDKDKWECNTYYNQYIEKENQYNIREFYELKALDKKCNKP